MLRKIALIILLFGLNYALGCDVCKRQQPAITRDWTHGTGPQSLYDWIIVAIMTLITLLVLFFSVKYLVKPKEKSDNHIKRKILNE